MENNIIFPTTNIIFSFNSRKYNADEIHTLVSSGVNVFNIDRTMHDNEYLQEMKGVIAEAENLPKMYQSDYYRPIGLAVTVSINEPIIIDERVDIIIVKNITSIDNFLEYKKQYSHINYKIFVWLTTWNAEESKYIIKFVDGVILDFSSEDRNVEEFCSCALEICKEAFKPVFYVKRDIVRDYYQLIDRDRIMLSIAKPIIVNRMDGVIICDSVDVEMPPSTVIRSLVRAFNYFENQIDLEKDYLDWSFKTKTPVLQPLTVACGASIAALKCEAKAIMVLSATGRSTRWLSCACPPCHILCITTRKSTVRQMHVYRKVIPLLYNSSRGANWQEECRNRIRFGMTFALKIGLFVSGAKLVVVSPSEEGIGYCNSFQIVSVPFHCED